MAEEEFIRKAAKISYYETHFKGSEAFVEETMAASLRFRKPQNKAIFFDEIQNLIRKEQKEHLQSCPKAPDCEAYKAFDETLYFLQEEINTPPFATQQSIASISHAALGSLTHLHPAVQQVASSLFATGHYREAILNAYIAIDNAVKEKTQLHNEYGTRLMERAFSINNPILKIGNSQDEQQGFLSLFRGAMLAIRNPKTHSLSGTQDEQRALEWLFFASVLLRNLDEATLTQSIPPN